MRLDAWHSAPPPHPHPLHNWLTDRGSLTARIISGISKPPSQAQTRVPPQPQPLPPPPQFNLVRLIQHLKLPNRDERRDLRLRLGELAVVREVVLRAGNRPLVFAHSVLAKRDLRGAWRGLSHLGSRPLAEMLFHDPTVARLPMEYKKIDCRHPLFQRAAKVTNIADKTIWARRSVFVKQGRALLVTEVFLSVPGADSNAEES